MGEPSQIQTGRAPRVHPIRGGEDRFVSPAGVLGIIGRATGHLSAKRRPSDAVRRAAVAAAAALAEMVREADPRFGSEPWSVEVPHDTPEIARRGGGSSAETEDGIALLLDTACLVAVSTAGERRLRLDEDVFAEHPALARIRWEAVRARLAGAGASPMPSLAVLREIGVLSGSRLEGELGPWIEVSLPRLMDATLFRRTAVSRALGDLERAGLVGRSPRAGREHGVRLLPAAFGRDDAVPSVPNPTLIPPPGQAPPTPQPGDAGVPVPVSTAPAVTLRFAGSEIRIHGGLACDVRPGTDGVPVLEIRPASP